MSKICEADQPRSEKIGRKLMLMDNEGSLIYVDLLVLIHSPHVFEYSSEIS